MEALIPWTQLLAVLEPFYPKGERGRPPVGLERMLRVRNFSRRVFFFLVANSAREKLGWCVMPQV